MIEWWWVPTSLIGVIVLNRLALLGFMHWASKDEGAKPILYDGGPTGFRPGGVGYTVSGDDPVRHKRFGRKRWIR